MTLSGWAIQRLQWMWLCRWGIQSLNNVLRRQEIWWLPGKSSFSSFSWMGQSFDLKFWKTLETFMQVSIRIRCKLLAEYQGDVVEILAKLLSGLRPSLTWH